MTMTLLEAMEARHSVRRYLDKPIEKEKAAALQAEIDKIPAPSGLRVTLVLEEPTAFSGVLAHYGSFRGCKNYFAVVGPKEAAEAAGYYGEGLVLKAQQLGLNTCWVAATYSKGKVPVTVPAGERLLVVIALGYGENQGVPHKSKPMEKLCRVAGKNDMPKWFYDGVQAAMLAPTAVNQQRFLFTLVEKVEKIEKKETDSPDTMDIVEATAPGGTLTRMDLGIAKYHFELGADGHPFQWA